MEFFKIQLEEQLLIKYYLIKHLILLKIQNMMYINADLLQQFIDFLIKKTLLVVVLQMRIFLISNKEIAQKLHKPILGKFEKRKVHSTFIDNIWGAYLADMLLISKFIKGIPFLLHVVDIYSNYAWFIPLKDKQGVTITNAFQKTLKGSNCCIQSKTLAMQAKSNIACTSHPFLLGEVEPPTKFSERGEGA